MQPIPADLARRLPWHSPDTDRPPHHQHGLRHERWIRKDISDADPVHALRLGSCLHLYLSGRTPEQRFQLRDRHRLSELPNQPGHDPARKFHRKTVHQSRNLVEQRKGLPMSRHIRLSPIDRTFTILVNTILVVSALLVLYPLVFIVSASFSLPVNVLTGKVWLWPVDLSLMSYEAVFKNAQILTGYVNSAIYAVVGTFVSVVLTVLAAYPLSRRTLYGRSFFMGVFIFTMLFSGGLNPHISPDQGSGTDQYTLGSHPSKRHLYLARNHHSDLLSREHSRRDLRSSRD